MGAGVGDGMAEPIVHQLLRRLQGPYGRALRTADFRVGLQVEHRQWLLYGRDGLPGVLSKVEGPVDGWLRCGPEDFQRMLTGGIPEDVRLILGDREGNPRRRQAHGLVVAAALGWAGPWPDPSAEEEHQRLLRRAMLDLRFGPEDGREALFATGEPLRRRMEVDGELLCTEGLTDQGMPEFWCRRGERRMLRRAVLAWKEGPYRELETPEGLVVLEFSPLPLARGMERLAEVRRG